MQESDDEMYMRQALEQAHLSILICQLLRKYKYPPDQQGDAVELVLRQVEVISEDAMAV